MLVVTLTGIMIVGSTSVQRLPQDVQALVEQTIDSLRGLCPPNPRIVSDEIKDAVFSAIDAVTADMRTLNLTIHGMVFDGATSNADKSNRQP